MKTLILVLVLAGTIYTCDTKSLNNKHICPPIYVPDTIVTVVNKLDTIHKDTIIRHYINKEDTISATVLVDVIDVMSKSELYEKIGYTIGTIKNGLVKGYRKSKEN